MDLHKKYGLTRIINACGKLTRTSNARVLADIKEPVMESLEHFFDADELMQKASEKIAAFSGAEAGFVTACSAAGITLCVAACMTGNDITKITKLPDTSGMKNKVVIQKGHAVNFGAPVTQMIKLAGAVPVETGSINNTKPEILEGALDDSCAALMVVVSHHTARYGFVPLSKCVEIAHKKGIPVIVDAAAQCFNLNKIISTGADLVICSGHKYLSGTVSGMVCGKKELIKAVEKQNFGIGRTMKVGKEGIFGLLAAIEYRSGLDIDDFYKQICAKVELVCNELRRYEGVTTYKTDDPNGNPFCRSRICIDPLKAGIDAKTVCKTAAKGDPSIRLRDHHVEEGYFDVDVVELTKQELETVVKKLKDIIESAFVNMYDSDKQEKPEFSWL